MVVIRKGVAGNPIQRKSRNLRGLMEHFRVVGAPCEIRCQRKPHGEGMLSLAWSNHDYTCVPFASYTVMLDWIGNRRILRSIPIIEA